MKKKVAKKKAVKTKEKKVVKAQAKLTARKKTVKQLAGEAIEAAVVELEEPVEKPAPRLLDMTTVKIGRILTVTWYDLTGSHAAGAVVEDYRPPTTTKSVEKGKGKVKDKVIHKEVEGVLRLSIYQPGEETFLLNIYLSLDGSMKAGSRYQTLAVTEPTEKDYITIQMLIGKSKKAAAEKPKREGNPAALAAAREQRQARTKAAGTQGIVVLVKVNPYKGKRGEIFDLACKAKTVGEFSTAFLSAGFVGPNGHLKRFQVLDQIRLEDGK